MNAEKAGLKREYIYVIAVLLIIGVTLIGITIFTYSPDFSKCETVQIGNYNEYITCMGKLVVDDQGHPICNKIGSYQNYLGTSKKTLCLTIVAAFKNDASFCDEIQENDEVDKCYVTVAVVQNDSFLCTKIQNQYYKDDCYHYIAVNKQNVSFCDEIQELSHKDVCYTVLA